MKYSLIEEAYDNYIINDSINIINNSVNILYKLTNEELDLLKIYINEKNNIVDELLSNDLIKKIIKVNNLESFLKKIFKNNNLNNLNNDLLKIEEVIKKNELSKVDGVNSDKIKKLVNEYSVNFQKMLIKNIKNILTDYKKINKKISGGNYVDNNGTVLVANLNIELTKMNELEFDYMKSDMYKILINDFIDNLNTISLIDNEVSLKDIAKKYWNIKYLNNILEDVYNYDMNNTSIIGTKLDSINTLNKIDNYLNEKKDTHIDDVFSSNMLSLHIDKSEQGKTEYTDVISRMNEKIKKKIMTLWTNKELNKPIGTISGELLTIMNDNVNSSDSYYSSDLQSIDKEFEISKKKLDNINTFISNTHSADLIKNLSNIEVLLGGYKLIDLDL